MAAHGRHRGSRPRSRTRAGPAALRQAGRQRRGPGCSRPHVEENAHQHAFRTTVPSGPQRHGHGRPRPRARALWPSGRVLLARRERQAFYQYFESCSTLHRSKTYHGHRVLRELAAQRQHSPRARGPGSRLSGTMTGHSPGLERGAGRVRGFSARLSSSESKTVTRTLVCARQRLTPTARGDRARTLAGTRSAKPLLRNTRETGSAGTGRLGPGERRRDAGGKAGRNGRRAGCRRFCVPRVCRETAKDLEASSSSCRLPRGPAPDARGCSGPSPAPGRGRLPWSASSPR